MSLFDKLQLPVPEWCLLSQALQWIADRKPIIEPYTYLDCCFAPEQHEMESARYREVREALLLALSSGKLSSNGSYFVRITSPDVWQAEVRAETARVLREAVFFDSDPATELAAGGGEIEMTSEPIEVCSDATDVARSSGSKISVEGDADGPSVDWNDWHDLTDHAFRQIEECEEIIPLLEKGNIPLPAGVWSQNKGIDWAKNHLKVHPGFAEDGVTEYYRIMIPTAQLFALFEEPRLADSEGRVPKTPVEKGSKRRAPPFIYSWERFFMEIAILAHRCPDGIPKPQKKLMDVMHAWCEGHWAEFGGVPADSMLRLRISALYGHPDFDKPLRSVEDLLKDEDWAGKVRAPRRKKSG